MASVRGASPSGSGGGSFLRTPRPALRGRCYAARLRRLKSSPLCGAMMTSSRSSFRSAAVAAVAAWHELPSTPGISDTLSYE